MSFRTLLVSSLISLSLAACGGGGSSQTAQSSVSPKYAAQIKASAIPVVFSGARADYNISTDLVGITVTPKSGSQTSTRVASNARLRFKDVTLAVDSLSQGSPGTIYRLYQAAFNRTPDIGGLSFWVEKMDQEGAWIFDIANAFVASAEFKQIYGTNPTNREIVQQLYRNVLQREGETTGVAFWVDILDSKRATLAEVLLSFTESAENIRNSQNWIQLQGGVKLLETGINYTTYATAVAGTARSALVTDLVTLDGSTSTVGEGKTASYNWYLVNKPVGSTASVYSSTTATPSFVPDVLGRYELLLLVDDGSNQSLASTVVITAVATADATVVTPPQNYVYLQSKTGDNIGQGKNYLYTTADSTISVSSTNNTVNVSVTQGTVNWTGSFIESNTHTLVDAGTFANVKRPNNMDASKGGLEWFGNGRSCNELTGKFIVDSVTYQGGTLKTLDLRFEQNCENTTGKPLTGRIHWVAP